MKRFGFVGALLLAVVFYQPSPASAQYGVYVRPHGVHVGPTYYRHYYHRAPVRYYYHQPRQYHYHYRWYRSYRYYHHY